MTTSKIMLIDRSPAGRGRQLLERELGDEYDLTYRDASTLDHPRWCDGESDAAVVVVRSRSMEKETKSFLEQLRRHISRLPILLVLESSDESFLRTVSDYGESDFVVLPVGRMELLARLGRLIHPGEAPSVARRGDEDELVEKLKLRLGPYHFIGRSPATTSVLRNLRLMSRCDGTVLFRGETGTGKELCARAVHYLSSRSGAPFVPVNCGALPMELFENELFGHDREAYTGAASRRHGLIRDAEHGTLFLDEIDSLPAAAQVKLLRLLQQREYRPLGSTRIESADVRVVAATNADLEKAVRDGRMREDFFYRINVLPITIPPLRDRRGDIAMLARHILKRIAGRMKRSATAFSNPAMLALVHHDWPGNVRELENVVERALVLADGRNVIDLADVQLPAAAEELSFRQAKSAVVRRFERSYIENLLSVHEGNITRSAIAAKKNRRAFWELIRKHELDPDRFRSTRPEL